MKNCPKCGSLLKPPDASYCIVCESYLDIKRVTSKGKSEKSSGKSVCCFTTLFAVALSIAFVVWSETPIGSTEEYVTEIFMTIFLFGIVLCLCIAISINISEKNEKKKTRTQQGIDLSFLKTEKRLIYVLYYTFFFIIILLSFVAPPTDIGIIFLSSFLTLLVGVSVILVIVKAKRVKYWLSTKDVISFFSIFFIIVGLWGTDYVSFLTYLFGILGVYTWGVWFASDLIKKRTSSLKWIGLSGVAIITVGIIWSITSASFTSIFIEYFGLYICVGFFFSELLQRNEVPGLEEVGETKIFEALMKDSKRLVEQGNNQYNKKGYEDSIDSWESAIKMYEKSLEFSPSSDQKEKIKSNLGMLQDNIINALEVSANKYNKRAIKAHDNQDLQKADQEWNHSVSNFAKLLKIIKSEKLNLETSKIKTKIESIRKNLEQLEIEKLCAAADKKLDDAQTLKDKEITIALKMATEAISFYSEALEKAKKNPEFTSLVENIKIKMFNVRNFQEVLEEKMDELIGIAPLTTEIVIEHDDDSDYKKVQSTIKADKGKKVLKIIREYEFIGGQVRFKVGLVNNTNNPLTNFKISFDLPDALKWVLYEPDKYERKGDSILIPKLGKNEKKTVSLYLEPINCMESPVNATISFFDVNDRPQAIPMKPKMISISCPIFFTKEEANIARVKKLQRSLTLRDKKIFPIVNDDALSLFFTTTLSVLGNYDIKLISREFSEEERFGEAWFYGITKVKKNRIITYIILDGENKTLEIEVSADDHGQITGFLAEIGNKIREELLKLNIIVNEEQFYDMSMSIHLNHCPYCWNIIPSEQIQGYLKGDPIDCKYCGETLTIKK
ncbi:MAG: hypothetical protein ACTSP6_05245 [Promethearchaeota archaeon]